MQGHKVEICNKEYPCGPGPKTRAGIEILIDGNPVLQCFSAALLMDARDVVRMRIEFYPQELDVNLDGVAIVDEKGNPS